MKYIFMDEPKLSSFMVYGVERLKAIKCNMSRAV